MRYNLHFLLLAMIIVGCETGTEVSPVQSGHFKIEINASKTNNIQISDTISLQVRIVPQWSTRITSGNPDTAVIMRSLVRFNPVGKFSIVQGGDSVWTDTFSKDSSKTYATTIRVDEEISSAVVEILMLPVDSVLDEFGAVTGIFLYGKNYAGN